MRRGRGHGAKQGDRDGHQGDDAPQIRLVAVRNYGLSGLESTRVEHQDWDVGTVSRIVALVMVDSRVRVGDPALNQLVALAVKSRRIAPASTNCM